MEVIEIFKVLADESRLRIFNILRVKKLCVCDIESILDLPQANVSRHLARMKNAGMIKSEKKSQWVYVWVDEECLEKYSFLKKLFKKDIHEEQLHKDRERLEKYLKDKKECKLEKMEGKK